MGLLPFAREVCGEMAEWFKAAVLKTVVGLHPTGGSNPSLSVATPQFQVISESH
jgi:hypothetical protein